MASTNKPCPDQFTNIQIDQVICSIGGFIDRSIRIADIDPVAPSYLVPKLRDVP